MSGRAVQENIQSKAGSIGLTAGSVKPTPDILRSQASVYQGTNKTPRRSLAGPLSVASQWLEHKNNR